MKESVFAWDPADRGWGAKRDKVRELRQALLFAVVTCRQATDTEEHDFLCAQISYSKPLLRAGEVAQSSRHTK
jgi:hypothetical protein